MYVHGQTCARFIKKLKQTGAVSQTVELSKQLDKSSTAWPGAASTNGQALFFWSQGRSFRLQAKILEQELELLAQEKSLELDLGL